LGNTRGFQETIIIMTSTSAPGTCRQREAWLSQSSNEATLNFWARLKTWSKGEVQTHLNPRFLNRLDEIILFNRAQASKDLIQILG